MRLWRGYTLTTPATETGSAMEFGLEKRILQKITGLLASVPEVDQAIIYGSRAKGNNREGSDIDITLKGEKLSLKAMNQLSLALDDLDLPYLFDLSIYHHIQNRDLLDHIRRVGKVIYSRPDLPAL